MDAREFVKWIDECTDGTPFMHHISDEEWRMIRSALKLLAAAESNDGSTPETDEAATNFVIIPAIDPPYKRLTDHARTLELARNGLAAEVLRLRAFHDYFRDRCEGLFSQFGMECIDLYNDAAIDSARAAK